jgi:hypothetical protein
MSTPSQASDLLRLADMPAAPAVAAAPAPWTLRGDGYVVLFKTTPAMRGAERFTPESLRGRETGGLGMMMFVDYAESPVGPYRELLWIPGKFRFGGRSRWSITRIYVSSWESVVNGNVNWGIPKDRASFAIEVAGAERRVTVERDGRRLADLRLREKGPTLPITTGWMPEWLLGLAQHRGDRTYYYLPRAKGKVRAGELLEARFDAELFPELEPSRIVGVIRVLDFEMMFPASRIAAGVR